MKESFAVINADSRGYTSQKRKNQHHRHVTTLIITAFICIVMILSAAYYLWRNPFWNNSTTTSETSDTDYSQQFNIAQVHSSNDADGDGVDDQIDILRSAREYAATKPKYKSKYYSTGYPDDGYGVCTDVVAQAFVGAGYDFRELVNADIVAHKSEYNITVPDKNIDFRRVSNLKIYFQHTATALTADPTDIDEWQGGDIVIFANHIGIVSDERDKNGVTYVIHHNNASQASYEQDILTTRSDITWHFRVK